jgi:hypothetical protein
VKQRRDQPETISRKRRYEGRGRRDREREEKEDSERGRVTDIKRERRV